MSSVEERLVLVAICFLISLPVSYIFLKNCVEINSCIDTSYNKDNKIMDIPKIESKNENNKTDIIIEV